MSRNTYTMQRVPSCLSFVDARHLAIYIILDICNIRCRISRCRIMGMECLLSQNKMGYTNPYTVCIIWRIHRSCQWNNRWYNPVQTRVLIKGFTLAAVYNAGFKMSTWIPFFWGLIQILTVVSAGYSTVSSIL